MGLVDLARSYLEAERYKVGDRGNGLLVGSRAAIGGGNEAIYVWVIDSKQPEDLRSRERSLLTAFGEANEVDPTSPKFLLVPFYEGLSTDFRRDARKWFTVTVTVPAFFFDTDFSWDAGRESPTAARVLQQRGESTRKHRIAQPFRTSQGGETGSDLSWTLLTKLSTPTSTAPSVHVVAGPAGVGKTILFESLYSELYRQFHDNKRAQVLSPRPLPLLPEYLAFSDAPTVRALVRAFLETDFVRALDVPVFEWMLSNGAAMWLLDGLDEVIAQDPDFLSYILELLTSPSAATTPRIVICVRDSLLSTNEDLRELCESYPEVVETYYLLPWERESKQRFADLRLRDKAVDFMKSLSARHDLDSLAATPYYCALLVDLYQHGELRDSYSEADLLRHALSSIIEREYDKGVLNPTVAPEQNLIELLETLALVDLEGGLRGIDVGVTREFAAAILPAQLSEAEYEQFLTQLAQLPLFASHGPNRLRFAQEILEQYVLGLAIIRAFEEKRDVFRHRLSYREIPREWTTLGVVADHIRTQGSFQGLVPIFYESLNRPAAFKNVLQIAAYAKPSSDALRLPELSFERQEVSGLFFEDCDFHDMSFRGADLTNTVFKNCNLQLVELEDAILKGTMFDLQEDALRGARIGDLTKFFSLRPGERGRTIDDPSAARKWFEERTGTRTKIVEPCPAAQQLRHLFGKFVYPTGAFRRSWLDRRGVRSGTRRYDTDLLLKSAVRFGYLLEADRDRISRPDGEPYSEIVGYMKDLKVTPGLQALLSEACDIPGCPHVPPAQ